LRLPRQPGPAAPQETANQPGAAHNAPLHPSREP
jgi:hypothetical protein